MTLKPPRNTLVVAMNKRHPRKQVFSDRRTKRSKQKAENEFEELKEEAIEELNEESIKDNLEKE